MEIRQSVISPLDIRTREGDQVIITSITPKQIKGQFPLAGFANMGSKGDFGQMTFHHYSGNGFSIWSSEYEIIRPVEFITRSETAVLELSIPLKANIYSGWDAMKEELIRDEQFELSYIPYMNNRTNFRNPSVCKTFDIHYSREYLDRFSKTHLGLGKFLEKVDRNEPVSLEGRSRFLSPAMKRIVYEILNFNMADNLSGFFYEGSALLMLTMMLDRFNSPSDERKVIYSENDKDCVEQARNILLSDLSEKYSIRALARKTGTSETKLQMAFKHLCGTTIFDFAQSARLDQAKLLLLDTNLTIQNISERCGYPDNSNLTAAFRKKFGIAPAVFRSKGK